MFLEGLLRAALASLLALLSSAASSSIRSRACIRANEWGNHAQGNNQNSWQLHFLHPVHSQERQGQLTKVILGMFASVFPLHSPICPFIDELLHLLLSQGANWHGEEVLIVICIDFFRGPGLAAFSFIGKGSKFLRLSSTSSSALFLLLTMISPWTMPWINLTSLLALLKSGSIFSSNAICTR